MLDKRIIYSAGYYPLMQERKDWEQDILRMKAAGIQLIRTAELFNTWDQIEPEKGKFRFEFLDDFFDLCQKHGMKILLGTGTAAPPYWIHEKYPDVNILNNHGQQYPNNVSYTWACINHVGYLNESERYIKTLVNRYKDHEALGAYQIHNEFGFPFMPLREGDIDIYCYCDHCKAKFKKWLKNKYKTLDDVNYAYRWGATNTHYTDWSQIEPPMTKPTSWSSVTRWLDWRLYWMDNFVEFISWQNKLIKTLDAEHVTSTNTFFLKSQDPLGVLTGVDQFEVAKVVDQVGYDLYPGSGNKLESKPEFSSMFLDMAESTVKPLNKKYWLLETESGPINGWVLGPHRNVNGQDLKRNIFEAVGHNSKLTLYQGWREWDFQPLHWGAIVDLDGQPTNRTKSAEEIGAILKENGESLYNASKPKGKVALLISKENAIVLNGMGQEAFLIKAMRGAYRVFWEKGYDIDFITPDILENGDYISEYSIIYMPFLAMVTQEMAQSLNKYVEAGGTLIGAARLGMLGKYGWYNHKMPCFDLMNTFGVEVTEVVSNTNPNITYNHKSYTGHWHKESLELKKDDVNVLARFNNDTPAVTLNNHGKGRAIYIATHPEVAYLEDNSYLLWDLIDSLNIKPQLKLDYSNRKDKEVDAHYLEGENEDWIIITNYVNQKHSGFFNNDKKKVRIDLEATKTYKELFDVTEDKPVEFKIEGNRVCIELEIIKNEVKLIKLK
ncbi:beta-galactosidase [Abyssisolibacter fermentans]|uniref:beta-galactosidase n=1 Tax=Abyssisolibacter fermentans TaxID=1766203 RepID=UPI0008318CA1|nr:beta-galactosidase [Abyssisolibacter fermentans]